MEVPISVVIIAKNEEKRIEECIKSVYEWAGEIVIVDDESTDATRDIAYKYTKKVFIRKMENEGRHRNWAHTQASFDWILSLDADERITPALQKEIKQVLEKNPRQSGFTIPRKNFIGNYWMRYGGQYPAAQLKIFRKEKFKWEEADVHPRAFMEGDVTPLENFMLHYTYRDFEDYLKKINGQSTLEARKWFLLYKTEPKKVNAKMNVSSALWRMIDRFFRAYIGKKGYKDGFIGFMVAYFGSLYQMVSYAKYWEMKKK
jgi:glycosyltransferase involved in cell wall biosynthesis